MELDLDYLKKPNFDVNSWLSKVLSSCPEEIQIEANLANLSALVENEIKQTNASLEDLTQQMIQNLPRAVRDLEVTHKEVLHLQKDMSVGLNEAENVQKKTTVSMTTLEKLDNIKSKLVATSAALQEADKWTSLAKQIEQLLDSGDVNKSYECILGMEKSLSVLNAAQAEERRLILEEMKNRLEALATKHLILAFDTNHTENARYFFTMFSNMERTQQFVKYFQNSEKLKLSQEWRSFVELLTFKEATVKFYDVVIDHMHSKIQWCKNIFSDHQEVNSSHVLVDLYTDTVQSLEPSLQFCFESETKKMPFIDVLIHFNQGTHRFAESVRQFADSQNLQLSAEKVKSLLKAIFQPFLFQYAKYAKFHEGQIVSKIQSATVLAASATAEREYGGLGIQEKIDNSKRLLPELILNIKEGEEKVALFNQGFGYLHFGKGLNGGLERFADWNQELCRFLEKSIQNPENHRNLLENTLSFTETCGEILIQLQKLDKTLTANCSKVYTKAVHPFDNPWENVWEFYLDNHIRTEISQFIERKDTLLSKAVNHLKKLCRDSTQLVLRVTAEPVEVQLKKNFALGDTSLKEAIPSEYITQLGEYLMLLPQNLDPFITSENSSIAYAFDQSSEEESRSPVDFLLSNLSASICEAYTERILKVVYLTDGQAKQLAQDIDYLASVLEDLGLRLTSDLTDISKLMKNYANTSDLPVSDRISSRLVMAVRKMKIKPLS